MHISTKEIIRYVKYVALSLFATATDTLVLWILSDFVMEGYVAEYIISPIISFECGVFVNYNISYRHVWNDRLIQMDHKSYWRHFLAFNATFAIGFLIKMGLLLGLEIISGWDVVLCNIIAVSLAGFFNYFITNFLVFRKNTSQVRVNNEIVSFIENEVLPLYDGFDKGHQRDHIEAVISQALELCNYYDVNPDMVYVAAAYHDRGICEGRENHHLVSGQIIRNDYHLLRWFDNEQIETIAQAAEDHRASSGSEPRTIYGKIIAEADRLIEPDTIIRRTVQFGLANCPDLDKESQYMRCLEHLKEKYAEGGYLKLYLPESPNAEKLAELRRMISDENVIRASFEKYYAESTEK